MEIEISVNEALKKIPVNLDISALLSHIKVPSLRGIAVAVNGCVVPREKWQEHKMQANDAVIIITASQGG